MSELTPKKQRTMEMVEKLLEVLPMQYKMMCMGFMPQCRRLLTDIPDEEIDRLIQNIREKLDYVSGGDLIE